MEGLTSAFTRSASAFSSPSPAFFSRAASALRAAVNSADGSLYDASTSSSSLRFVSLTLRSSFVSCFPLFLPIRLVSHCFPKTQKPERKNPTSAKLFENASSVLICRGITYLTHLNSCCTSASTSASYDKAVRNYGFAARCEAVATPRRCVPCVIWAVPLVRARPWIHVTLKRTCLNWLHKFDD